MRIMPELYLRTMFEEPMLSASLGDSVSIGFIGLAVPGSNAVPS